MHRYVYGQLEAHQAALLGTVDRSEQIDALYRRVDGVLRLEPAQQAVTGWQSEELDALVARLQRLPSRGGRAFGGWHDGRLVGVGALDATPVASALDTMRLDMLYVSAAHRARGIGRRLVELVARHARSLGATRLYVSATPTRASVDFYRRLGAEVLERPDPELFSREPDDIHLCLRLP
jgi:GNAT superfamily N-acetyltransferase